MMYNKPRAVPDDFATVAALLPVTAIMQHYATAQSTAVRWCREMPLEWQYQRNLAVEARRRDAMTRGRTRANEVTRARAASLYPADMEARFLAADNVRALARELGVGVDAVRNWARDRAELRAARLARIATTKPVAVPKRVAAAKPHRRQSKPSAATFIGLTPGADASIAGRAADHLKRCRFIPVFDASKVYGTALAGIYVVGRMKLPTADMIALAESKGWDRDEWKRVAA